MMNTDKSKFVDLSKKILKPGRSLLLPMIVLALGLHAALLALPIPSSEAQKEPDDKKNPITVTQLPTEKPAAPAPKPNVAVPPLGTTTVSDSAAATSSESSGTGDTSSSAVDSTDSFSTSEAGSDTASAVSSAQSAKLSNGNSSNSRSSETPEPSSDNETKAPGASTNTEATANPEMVAAGTNTSGSVVKPFADFPHYQPSEADCFGLGFGDNCRTVQNGAIAEVSEFFKKELGDKEFTATLVTDEPARKVFKVEKGDKTLFLNIWQGKGQVAYLLSRVIVKQSPEKINTETAQ